MLLVVAGLLLHCSFATAVEVDITGLGKLKGKEEVARDGTRFFSFIGVPYAEPPIGSLRFERSILVKPWEGVKDATKHGQKCIQHPYNQPTKIVGSEDCLFMSIHTKNLDESAKKPVIMYIHGGAFIFGDIDGVGAEYMMEQDIVFISVQYRLGPFGFLSTEDKIAPGNYGLHDQRRALEWIQQFIHQFGGNKDLVTIMGLSAGGASVHYHVLSPSSAGLFHRAISFSGSSLCWWANLANQRATTVALASKMDCPTHSSRRMVDCFKEKSAEDIIAAQRGLYAWHGDKVEAEPLNIWSPRPDPEAGEEAILPVHPHLAMEVGQIQPVPFLVGVAESEGIWRAVNFLTQDEVMMEFMTDFKKVAPLSLGLVGQVKESEMIAVLKKIKKFYLSSMKNEQDLDKRLRKVVNGMVQMFGDSMFNYPIDRMVKLHGNKDYAPVWMYEFNYKNNHTLANFDVARPGVMRTTAELLEPLQRATHGHELSMLFPQFEDVMGPLSEEETKQSRKFVKLIVDFAIQGNPTQDRKYEMSDWKPVANGQLSHYVFGKYSATQKGLPFQHRMKWWRELPVYWNKEAESSFQEKQDGATVQTNTSEDEGKENLGERGRYAENVEELTAEEVEDLEVNKILKEIKDEL